MKSKIVYAINTEDVQTVALQEIDRTLTKNEIKMLSDLIGEKIAWHEIIANVIAENIEQQKNTIADLG